MGNLKAMRRIVSWKIRLDWESLTDRGLDDRCMYCDTSSQKIISVSLQFHVSKTSGEYWSKSSWALQAVTEKMKLNSYS